MRAQMWIESKIIARVKFQYYMAPCFSNSQYNCLPEQHVWTTMSHLLTCVRRPARLRDAGKTAGDSRNCVIWRKQDVQHFNIVYLKHYYSSSAPPPPVNVCVFLCVCVCARVCVCACVIYLKINYLYVLLRLTGCKACYKQHQMSQIKVFQRCVLSPWGREEMANYHCDFPASTSY